MAIIFVLSLSFTFYRINQSTEKVLEFENENEILKENAILKEVEISNLISENESLKESVKQKDDEIFELNQSLEKSQSEIDTLKKEVKNLKKIKSSTVKSSSSAKGKEIKVSATAYTATCDGCSGITYTGHDVRNTIYKNGNRIIAVDPSVIPLGSKVKVETDNGLSFVATAQDIGGAIKGRKIDILVATKSRAYEIGRVGATVKILE